MTFSAQSFNRANYERVMAELNAHLADIEKDQGFPAAIEALRDHQFHIGFIQDDLTAVKRWQFRDEKARLVFRVQFNPRRADRTSGLGRKDAPPGEMSLHHSCFLCPENIRWQQRGIEMGYETVQGETEYVVWMNPFPLMPLHVTIARKTHEAQSWFGANAQETKERIYGILQDLIGLTGRLPGFIGFFNAKGAGATIPDHFHYQFFRRLPGDDLFPLEVVGERMTVRPVVISCDEYPLTTIYFSGDPTTVVDDATEWIFGWTNFYSGNPTLSANVMTRLDPRYPNMFHLYFVPRNSQFVNAPGMVGAIGGLEALGEIVFATEIEKQQIDIGRVNAQFIWDLLESVEAPGVREFVKRISLSHPSAGWNSAGPMPALPKMRAVQ